MPMLGLHPHILTSSKFDLAMRNQQQPDPPFATVLNSIDFLQEKVKFVGDAQSENAGEDATSLLQAQFSQLSTLYANMLEGLDARRHEIDREHDERLASLAAEDKRRRDEFEEEKQSEEKRIADVRRELDARAKELDDRNHMHVRRGLREDITKEIQSA